MSRFGLRLATLLVAIATLAATADPAEAEAAEVYDLAPAAGYGSWQASNEFLIEWKTHLDPGQGPTGFGYRFRDSSGQALEPGFRIDEATRTNAVVAIPYQPGDHGIAPGEYRLELWLETKSGKGEPVATTLRFDDRRPAPTQLLAPGGWVRAGESIALLIERAPRAPLSGIQGYALVIDHGSGEKPCGGRGRCRTDEINVPADSAKPIVVGPLAEQTSIARITAVSGSGMGAATAEGVELKIDGTPPAVTVAGVPGGWSNGPVTVAALATDRRSGMVPSGPTGPRTAIAVDGGAATVELGAAASATVHGEGIHAIAAYARDAVGNFSEGGDVSDPPPSALVRIDETPPQVSFLGPRDPAQPERIVALVSDSLSGPDASGGTIAVRPDGSRQAFEPLPTTASGGQLTAIWDSDSFPPGRYEFRATAFDTAGNRGAGELRGDGGRMLLDNPLKNPTALAFGFGARQLVWHRCSRHGGELRCHRQLIGPFEQRPAARSVGYGRSVPVAGRLTTATGQPLAGLPVEVTEIFDPGAESTVRQTTVLTAADGVFLAHLPPGPSRRIEVGFAGSPVLTRAGGSELRLGVHAAVRLRSSTAAAAIGGAPVVFSGTVAHEGARLPATGLPVELQFRLPGTDWSEFRTVQTGPGGRFRYPYAFSDDDSRGVRFQFRAHLAAQAGWPFEPGTSRPIAVTGR